MATMCCSFRSGTLSLDDYLLQDIRGCYIFGYLSQPSLWQTRLFHMTMICCHQFNAKFNDIIISMFCCLPEDKTVVRLVNIVDGSKDIVDNPKSRDKT